MRIVVTLTCIFISQVVFALELPSGWRLPTENELLAEPLRKHSPTMNAKIEGDFNGDGKTDYALLLKSTKFSGEGLAVKLSSSSGYSWQIVSKVSWGQEYPNINLVMGIDYAEKELPEYQLPGILHYRFESSASVWHWQAVTNSFKQTWVSD